MRLILLLLALLAALLLTPPGPAPALAAPAPPVPDEPSLAGRNCGGTSRPGMLASAGLAANEAGWELGGPLDTPPAAVNQLSPGVAIGPTGQVFYTWQETRGADTGDIFAAALGAVPTAGRRAVRVDDTGSAAVEQAAPSLAVDATGTLHVVWEDMRSGTRRLYYANSADAGATWSANSHLTATLPALSHSSPHLVAGPDGNLYLAWDAGNAIYFSRRVAGTWSTPAPIDATPVVDRDRPRLLFDGAGRLLAAWEDYRNPAAAVYIARLSQPATGAWGAELRASPVGALATQPSLALAPDGMLYLAYQGDPGIFLHASVDGVAWSTPRRIDEGEGDAFTNPRLAVDETGAVHCIWCRLRVNAGADVMAARSLDGGANWTDRATLATTTGTAEPLDLIASGRAVFAAWSDDGSGRPTLHTARRSDEQRVFLPLLRQ